MNELHKLLVRQFKKHLGILEIPDYLNSFINSIDEAYKQGDVDRLMTERSLELSSNELLETIDQLKKTQTELVERENQIKKIAYYDVLTGIPNRYMLNNFISDPSTRYNENNNNYAVLFIDLDNFKKINDSFGHSIGDNTLLKAAHDLEDCIGKGDKIFRYGGDEFVIILNNANCNEIISIATTILSKFNYPYIINEHEVYTTPSIGISLSPADGNNMETIIKNADVTMYIVKETGKNNFKFFSKDIEMKSARKLDLEHGLRKALHNKELFLLYQPQINLETGEICGLEALIRWIHPTLGIISPSEFIPIAEETGFIIAIGEWVLETACKQNKIWQESGLLDVPVAVNVSVVQLQNSNFIEMVNRQLRATQINPNNLVIEFTESIMQDTSHSFNIVNSLKDLGVKVAIDDFGTGFSSLSLIKDINIDILKIDAYFIKDIVENLNTLIVIKLIIELGNKLNFDIIMEGIETELQASIIKENGCKIGQGYLFSFPLSVNDLEQYIRGQSI